jgi:carbonic anhydrase
MSVAETLAARNADFAAHRFPGGMTLMPKLRTIVIGCVDPRVAPEDVLGLELGEAAEIRNVGGRVTPGLLAELAMLRKVTQAAGGDIGAGWELVVLHHTDCGITRLGGAPDLLGAFFGVAEDELPAKAIDDPRAAVAVDVAALRAAPGLDDAIVVSGLVYDVATGRVETVVAAAPLRG